VVLLWVLLVHLGFLVFLVLQDLHHLLAALYIIKPHSSCFESMLGLSLSLLMGCLVLIAELCSLLASL
jgi:hypothetical protein